MKYFIPYISVSFIFGASFPVLANSEIPSNADVCFFSGENYTGDKYCATTGEAWVGSSNNDVFSSVKVRANKIVVAYRDSNFESTRTVLESSVAKLSHLQANNSISSFQIFSRPVTSDNEACFFSDNFYQGNKSCYSTNNPWVGSAVNDSFSSVALGNNVAIAAGYRHGQLGNTSGFQPPLEQYFKDTPVISSQFDNQISAVTINQSTAPSVNSVSLTDLSNNYAGSLNTVQGEVWKSFQLTGISDGERVRIRFTKAQLFVPHTSIRISMATDRLPRDNGECTFENTSGTAVFNVTTECTFIYNANKTYYVEVFESNFSGSTVNDAYTVTVVKD